MTRFSVPFVISIFLILAACSNQVEKDKRKLLSVLHSAYFSAQASYGKLGYFPDDLPGLRKRNDECQCVINYYSFKDRFYIKVEKGEFVYTIDDKKTIVDRENKVIALSELPVF